MNSEHKRWLDAAADYVRLRDELRQKQAAMDTVRATLGECVDRPAHKEQAILLRDLSVVVLIERCERAHGNEIAVHVKPVIA